MKTPIKDITVAGRFRRDLGDLSKLKKSMEEIGQLQPIGVSSSDVLVFGQRRLKAAKELGWKDIEARVLDLDNPLLAEFDENECRKPFSPSEKVAIAAAIEEREAERAKERQRDSGGDRKSEKAKIGSQKIGEPKGHAAESKAKAAKAVGMSAPTLAKAQEVVAAAEKNPALAPIVEEMDRTGKVDPAYRKVREHTNGNGKPPPVFEDRTITQLISKLTQAFDDRYRLTSNKNKPEYENCLVAMDRVIEAWKAWQAVAH